jgi:hypothetical protein
MAATRIHWQRDGSLAQLLPAVILCHYLVYIFPALGIIYGIYASALVPRVALVGSVLIYIASLCLYKPHRGRGWPGMRWVHEHRFWDGVPGYLDTTFVREAPLDPSRQYMFAIAPHGVLSIVRGLFAGTTFPTLFPGIYARWAAATPQFLVPFGAREISLCFQAIDASKSVLLKAIGRGESILLFPGGTKELMLTDPHSTTTCFACKDRLGFVRLAVSNGMPIVPVVCFGEKWCYRLILLPEAVRRFLYQYRVPGCMFMGRLGTLLGHTLRADGATPISFGLVFGKPIEVGEPISEVVDPARFQRAVADAHGEYCRRMAELFEGYKREFGYGPEETCAIVDANPKRG